MIDKRRESLGDSWAIARSEHRATQATPGAPTGLRHTVSVGYRGATVYPLFTSRTLRPPRAKGHREWMGDKR